MLAKAVAHYLTELEILDYRESAVGGNTFIDWMPDSPDLAVALMSQPGRPQRSKLPHDLPGLQAIVRAPAQKSEQAHNLATEILEAMNGLAHTTLDPDGEHETIVVGCTASQSAPVPIGRDDKDRPEYSVNLDFHTHNPTSHRPGVNA